MTLEGLFPHVAILQDSGTAPFTSEALCAEHLACELLPQEWEENSRYRHSLPCLHFLGFSPSSQPFSRNYWDLMLSRNTCFSKGEMRTKAMFNSKRGLTPHLCKHQTAGEAVSG